MQTESASPCDTHNLRALKGLGVVYAVLACTLVYLVLAGAVLLWGHL